MCRSISGGKWREYRCLEGATADTSHSWSFVSAANPAAEFLYDFFLDIYDSAEVLYVLIDIFVLLF